MKPPIKITFEDDKLMLDYEDEDISGVRENDKYFYSGIVRDNSPKVWVESSAWILANWESLMEKLKEERLKARL